MAEDILTTRPGTYQQDVLQSFLSLSIMVKWMTDANNASNVISEVKRTPLAAMTHLLISTKGALRRPITYITAVKRHCTDGVTKCPKTLQIMSLGMTDDIQLGRRKYTFPATFVNSFILLFPCLIER